MSAKWYRRVAAIGAVSLVGLGSIVGATCSCVIPTFNSPATTGNIWIDGGAGTCTRSASLAAYDGATACASMQAAQTAMSAGDTAILHCGAYSAQTISTGAKASAVTFEAETYDAASTAAEAYTATSCATVSSLTIGIDKVHIVGIQATQQPWAGDPRDDSAVLLYQGGGSLSVCNTPCSGGTTDIVVDGYHGRNFFGRVDHVTVENSNFGGYDACYNVSSVHIPSDGSEYDGFRFWQGSQGSSTPTPTTSTLKNSVIHDILMGVDDSEAASICTYGSTHGPHDDCMQNNGGDQITIAANIFFNCPTSNIQWHPFSGATMGTQTIENNYFGPTGCCNSTVLGSASDGGDCSGIVFQNNTSYQVVNAVHCTAGSVVARNNIFLGSHASCIGGTAYDYNLFNSGGSTCGTNSRHADPTFLNPPPTGVSIGTGPPDPHLDPADTAAVGLSSTSFPATDIDGDARPITPAATPDSGPDEIS